MQPDLGYERRLVETEGPISLRVDVEQVAFWVTGQARAEPGVELTGRGEQVVRCFVGEDECDQRPP